MKKWRGTDVYTWAAVAAAQLIGRMVDISYLLLFFKNNLSNVVDQLCQQTQTNLAEWR